MMQQRTKSKIDLDKILEKDDVQDERLADLNNYRNMSPSQALRIASLENEIKTDAVRDALGYFSDSVDMRSIILLDCFVDAYGDKFAKPMIELLEKGGGIDEVLTYAIGTYLAGDKKPNMKRLIKKVSRSVSAKERDLIEKKIDDYLASLEGKNPSKKTLEKTISEPRKYDIEWNTAFSQIRKDAKDLGNSALTGAGKLLKGLGKYFIGTVRGGLPIYLQYKMAMKRHGLEDKIRSRKDIRGNHGSVGIYVQNMTTELKEVEDDINFDMLSSLSTELGISLIAPITYASMYADSFSAGLLGSLICVTIGTFIQAIRINALGDSDMVLKGSPFVSTAYYSVSLPFQAVKGLYTLPKAGYHKFMSWMEKKSEEGRNAVPE